MNSDITICVSNAVKQHMDKGALRKKLVVVYNGIECGTPMSKEAARAALAVPKKNGYWIGMIAELHPTKRVDLAIDAFAHIARPHPDAELIVLGAGEERSRLEKHIAEKYLGDRIHLLGFVKDAATFLPAFDLFLLPSRTEAFAFVALEAGCASLPVIASNVGGIPEIITNGDTGILATSGNVESFAHAMAELMNNPARAKKLGESLKARVARDFTRGRMLSETFKLYSQPG
jgi:glycosyltransferase involved in cell wall biosynthesis